MLSYVHLLPTIRLLLVSATIACLSVLPARAIDIQEVETESGIKALLVEDYTLPIIAMSYSFLGGATQDEPGKEGTLRLMTALMDEGAGELDSVAFQSRMETLGIDLGFSASRDNFSGNLRTVRSELESATDLLAMAINEPRFDVDAVERMRDALRTNLIRSETDPGFQARRALRNTVFPGHPYARNIGGNLKSIDTITRDDMLAMKEKILSRETLMIGVVGAISPEELRTMLDRVFGKLSTKSSLEPVADIEPVLGKQVEVEMPTPNMSIQMIYRGIERSDPDFFAAHMMNHVLGGGTFSSRLYEEVREKRGLAYGVNSGISILDHAQFLAAGTSTRADNGAKAMEVIRTEIRRMVDEGVSEEELEKAKKYVAGSYAIANLDTSAKIARVLVAIQREKLGLDYIDTREAQIAAVSVEDVNRMARQLLDVDPTVIVVRPPEQPADTDGQAEKLSQ